jgi:hypothetical protein
MWEASGPPPKSVSRRPSVEAPRRSRRISFEPPANLAAAVLERLFPGRLKLRPMANAPLEQRRYRSAEPLAKARLELIDGEAVEELRGELVAAC